MQEPRGPACLPACQAPVPAARAGCAGRRLHGASPSACLPWRLQDEDGNGKVNVQVGGQRTAGRRQQPQQAGCRASAARRTLHPFTPQPLAATHALPHPLPCPTPVTQECCAAIAKVFVDRRNLAASLKDARTIVGKLETVIAVVLHIFMFFL